MPSSVVASFSYNKEKQTLTVVFVSGLVYDYLNVPEETYMEMRSSGSKGIFLNTRIKNHYKFRKVAN